MNLKKHLQTQAEKDAENLLNEEDELFIQQLVQSGAPAATRTLSKAKKFWISFASIIATAVVASIIVVPVMFANRTPGGIFYQESNIREQQATFEEMQSDLKYFEIVENNLQYSVILKYDSVSNDKLYYVVEGTAALSSFTFNIVINENYNYNYSFEEQIENKQFADFSLSYEAINISGTGAKLYKGLIKNQTEYIYLEYRQLIDIGEQAFFDDIQNIIKIKN